MPLTDAQKQARYTYAKKSLKRIPLDVQKEKYDEIKGAAEAAGESVNGYIKKAIDERMAADKTPDAVIRIESPAALPSAHPEAAPVPTGCANQLPSETWTAAEAGSSCTGKTVTEFIDRAISEQTRRDDVSLRLGVNPVTGERLEPKDE